MPKTKLTVGEKAFLKQYNGASLDEQEIAAGAETLAGGNLADAARGLRMARERFERELERIGFEHG